MQGLIHHDSFLSYSLTTEFWPPYCPKNIVQVTEAGCTILKLWSSECDKDEWLSVPELELHVELSIAFDFCSSYCFIFIIFWLVYSFTKIRWGFQFTMHSHWGSIKIAG